MHVDTQLFPKTVQEKVLMKIAPEFLLQWQCFYLEIIDPGTSSRRHNAFKLLKGRCLQNFDNLIRISTKAQDVALSIFLCFRVDKSRPWQWSPAGIRLIICNWILSLQAEISSSQHFSPLLIWLQIIPSSLHCIVWRKSLGLSGSTDNNNLVLQPIKSYFVKMKLLAGECNVFIWKTLQLLRTEAFSI